VTASAHAINDIRFMARRQRHGRLPARRDMMESHELPEDSGPATITRIPTCTNGISVCDQHRHRRRVRGARLGHVIKFGAIAKIDPSTSTREGDGAIVQAVMFSGFGAELHGQMMFAGQGGADRMD